MPADKSNFGNFESLAQENKQIIKNILESTASVSPVDAQILSKIRGFYSSCLDEDTLDEVGAAPLLRFVGTVRKLFSGNSTDNVSQTSTPEDKRKGLTAALAFLHSRGGYFYFYFQIQLDALLGIDALFSFIVEGDVGVDPNHMVLWFNQPELGLPSKVFNSVLEPLKQYSGFTRNILKRNPFASSMSKSSNDCF